MNSGCCGYEISKFLVSINVIDIKDCKEKEIKREQIKFFYGGTFASGYYSFSKLKIKISKEDIQKTKRINRGKISTKSKKHAKF